MYVLGSGKTIIAEKSCKRKNEIPESDSLMSALTESGGNL